MTPIKTNKGGDPIDLVVSEAVLCQMLQGNPAVAWARLGSQLHPVRLRLAGTSLETISLKIGEMISGSRVGDRRGARGTKLLDPSDPGEV